METFISEAIEPSSEDGGAAFDAAAMARGEPGLPVAFRWRDQVYTVRRVIRRWKASGPEVGRLKGQVYLRRHCFELAMSDGAIWNVYFLRHAPRGGGATRRWFLYSMRPHQAEAG